MTILGIFIALALAVGLGAHVVMIAGIAWRVWWRAPFALLIPPLAPYWGWQLGFRKRVAVWWISVILYAVGVTFAAR